MPRYILLGKVRTLFKWAVQLQRKIIKKEENHLVCAGFRRVNLQLHRVSTFSSSEENTNLVEETTNSVERTEVKIKIVVTMAITALLVLGQ